MWPQKNMSVFVIKKWRIKRRLDFCRLPSLASECLASCATFVGERSSARGWRMMCVAMRWLLKNLASYHEISERKHNNWRNVALSNQKEGNVFCVYRCLQNELGNFRLRVNSLMRWGANSSGTTRARLKHGLGFIQEIGCVMERSTLRMDKHVFPFLHE